MNDFLIRMTDTTDQSVILIFLVVAVFRLYLEVINFDFSVLPIANKIKQVYGKERVNRIHRTGLIIAIGYIVLFAPGLLFA